MDIAQTKLRLIREAVQDNVPRPQSRFTRGRSVRVPAHRRLSVWLLGFSAIGILVYLCTFEVALPHVSPAAASTALSLPASKTGTVAAGPEVSVTLRPARIAEAPPRPLDRRVFPLSVRKVVVDAGHGGVQFGAVSESGTTEKKITLDVALRLRRLLEAASFQVLMTRETDETVGLDKRVELANSNQADLFVSIHVNWMPSRNLRALETYYLGPTDDSATTKLATRENRDSGYALSEYRLLLEKTYMDTRRDQSRSLAKAIDAELYRSVHQIDPVIEDRGVKMAPFIVLIRTEMPAILVEVSCLSNAEDVKLLTNDDYKENIARALLAGIRSYANDLTGSEGRMAKNGRE